MWHKGASVKAIHNFAAIDDYTKDGGQEEVWLLCNFCNEPLRSWVKPNVKGNLRSKKSWAQMKEREKCKKKTSHHRPQWAQWFSRYSISKSGIWAIWTSPFCRFLASFSLKYDVTDAMLQDIGKMKVQYLISLLFDLFEILQAVRSEQMNFAWL